MKNASQKGKGRKSYLINSDYIKVTKHQFKAKRCLRQKQRQLSEVNFKANNVLAGNTDVSVFLQRQLTPKSVQFTKTKSYSCNVPNKLNILTSGWFKLQKVCRNMHVNKQRKKK